MSEEQYDVFISYSRRDRAFAEAIERALEHYRPPRDLGKSPLRVFRDINDFTGNEYAQALEKHLQASSKLLLICSPHARQSPYVNEEIRTFCALKGREHVVPVMVAGAPNNEVPADDATRAFPAALTDAFQMPLAADFRGFDTHQHRIGKRPFEMPWYTVLANLYDVRIEAIEERERKRSRRRANVRLGLASAAALLCVGTLGWLAWTRSDAYHLNRSLSQGALISALEKEPSPREWVIALAAGGRRDEAIAAARRGDSVWRVTSLLQNASKTAVAAKRTGDAQAYVRKAVEIAMTDQSPEFSTLVDAAVALDLAEDARRLFEHCLSRIGRESPGDAQRQFANLAAAAVALNEEEKLLDAATQRLGAADALGIAAVLAGSAVRTHATASAKRAITRAIGFSSALKTPQTLDSNSIAELLDLCLAHNLSSSCLDLSNGLLEVGGSAETTIERIVVELFQKGREADGERLFQKWAASRGFLGDIHANDLPAHVARARGLLLAGNPSGITAADAVVSRPGITFDQLIALADAALAAHDTARAAQWGQQALRLTPSPDLETRLLVARRLAQAGLPRELVVSTAGTVQIPVPGELMVVDPEQLRALSTRLVELATAFYKLGHEDLAASIGTAASSSHLRSFDAAVALLQAAHAAGRDRDVPTRADEVFSASVFHGATPDVEGLATSFLAMSRAPEALAALHRISDRLLSGAELSFDGRDFIEPGTERSYAAFAVARALATLGDKPGSKKLELLGLKTMTTSTDPERNESILGSLQTLATSGLSAAELAQVDAAIREILAAIRKNSPEDIGRPASWLMAVKQAGFPDIAAKYLDGLIAELDAAQFQGLRELGYPTFVCALTFFDRNVDAMRVADDSRNFRLTAYAALAAHLASKEWRTPRPPQQGPLCNSELWLGNG